jgi:hypothetical protein
VLEIDSRRQVNGVPFVVVAIIDEPRARRFGGVGIHVTSGAVDVTRIESGHYGKLFNRLKYFSTPFHKQTVRKERTRS